MGSWVTQLILAAAVAVGSWIGTRIIKPTDKDRAEHLDVIARAAAALVVGMNPTAPWATLLQNVVNQILTAAGLPTSNRAAIERAAANALASLGRLPDANHK